MNKKQLSILFTALSLALNVQMQAQSKLTATALQQLTREVSTASPRHAPTRDSRPQRIATERITEGYVRLVLHLTPDADIQAVTHQLSTLGGSVLSRLGSGDKLFVQLPAAAVGELEQNPSICTIDGTHPVQPMCNLARRDMGVDLLHHATADPALQLPQNYDGTGVIVGVIDKGFDYQHFNFRDSEGRSRIRAVMQIERDPADSTKICFVRYETPEKIAQLTTDPKVSPTSFHSHGSHVAGIAAGSAYLPVGVRLLNDSISRMAGMAPNADLVLCSISLGITKESILSAVQYIFNYADSVGRPAVVNGSWGVNGGLQDGTDIFSETMGTLLGDRPGHALCIGAGNEGNKNMSFRKVFEHDGDSILLTLEVGGSCEFTSDDDSPITYNFLYNDSVNIYDRFSDQVMQTVDTTSTVKFSWKEFDLTIENEPSNNRSNLCIHHKLDTLRQKELDNLYPDGRRFLSVMIYGKKGQALRGYASPSFAYLCDLCPEAYIETGADYSISDYCCNPYVISVGAHVTRTNYVMFRIPNSSYILYRVNAAAWGDTLNEICSFSSYGQDFYGNSYPMISAPGEFLCSSMNQYEPTKATYDWGYTSIAKTDDECYFWGWSRGTSMSTPAVSGVVALMLQANPQLTGYQIQDYLCRTATHDAYTDASPHRFGAGKVNALAAVQAVVADLIPVGIDQMGTDGQSQSSASRKVMRRGNFVIERDGSCFSVWGTRVNITTYRQTK